MTKEDFLSQVSDHINKSYEVFETYQNITWDILKHTDSIFRANNLQYQLAFGSLLGAIRDGGKIPWDYDVDIFVKITNYNELISVLDSNLGEDYYYVWTNNMKDYPAECLRICKKGYTYMSFHVDVFFLIGCPENEKDIIKFVKKLHRYASLRNYRHAFKHLPWPAMSRLKSIILHSYYKLLNLIPESYLVKKEFELFHQYNIDDSSKWAVYSVDTKWGDKNVNIYPSDFLKETVDYRCEDGVFMIPRMFDEYLKCEFGSYMEYLPIEVRFTEFYKQLQQISSRQSFYLNNELKK